VQLLGGAFAVITLAVVVLPWAISLHQAPTYQASIKILVGQESQEKPYDTWTYDAGGLQELTVSVARAVSTVPVARAVVERLDLPEGSAKEVLRNTSAEAVPGTLIVNVTYKDPDPKRAQLIANAIGQVASQRMSEVSVGNAITATVLEPATLPKTPVSPNPVRNVVLALAAWGSMLGLLIAARASLGNPIRLPQRNVFPEYTAGSLEAAKEKELLEALGRSPSGELTAAGAALETSLSVEEADRMLSGLAARGHLRVRASEPSGGLFYSFWPRS
jgi:capsular polysaccharide biosynthesis protein